MAGEGGSGLPTCNMQVLRSFLLVAGLLVVAQIHHLALGMKEKDKFFLKNSNPNSQRSNTQDGEITKEAESNGAALATPKITISEEEQNKEREQQGTEKDASNIRTETKTQQRTKHQKRSSVHNKAFTPLLEQETMEQQKQQPMRWSLTEPQTEIIAAPKQNEASILKTTKLIEEKLERIESRNGRRLSTDKFNPILDVNAPTNVEGEAKGATEVQGRKVHKREEKRPLTPEEEEEKKRWKEILSKGNQDDKYKASKKNEDHIHRTMNLHNKNDK